MPQFIHIFYDLLLVTFWSISMIKQCQYSAEIYGFWDMILSEGVWAVYCCKLIVEIAIISTPGLRRDWYIRCGGGFLEQERGVAEEEGYYDEKGGVERTVDKVYAEALSPVLAFFPEDVV